MLEPQPTLARFQTLAQLLLRHQPLWRLQPFQVTGLPWAAAYPALAAYVAGLSEAHCEALAHVQATPGDSRSALCVLDGPTLIARLNHYLTQIETLIHTPDPTDPKKLRVSLAALDQARKTVETMSKLYLDVMKAQLDAEVQGEFRRIVMECINAADPATRQRIIAEIQSRTAIFGTLGGAGM